MAWAKSNRGQSVVIGSLLIFAIFIGLLGMLQAFAIPDDIAAQEQNHAAAIENEFTQLYSAATSVSDTSRQSITLTLGVDYNPRMVFITPPSATGTLQSAYLGNITAEVDGDPTAEDDVELEDDFINRTCGFPDGVRVKSLQYTPNYNEYNDQSQRTYETGIRSKTVQGSVLSSDQSLIRAGPRLTTLNLMPVTTGSVSTTQTAAESVSFESGATGEILPFTIEDDEAVEITLPVSDARRVKTIYKQRDTGDIDVATSDGDIVLTLNEGRYRVMCTPVGINDRPDNNPDSPAPPGSSSEDTGAFNPIGDDDLVYVDTHTSGNDLEWEFRNRDKNDAKVINRTRIPWSSEPGMRGERLDLKKNGSEHEVYVGDSDWTEVDDDNPWRWPAEQNQDLRVIDIGPNPNSDYALVFEFEDGTTSTYFINAPS